VSRRRKSRLWTLLAVNEPIHIEGGRLDIPGWNPDDPKYEGQFPDHPVGRVRRAIDRLVASLVIADAVRALPGFALPENPA
jgi:hypothetical protein